MVETKSSKRLQTKIVPVSLTISSVMRLQPMRWASQQLVATSFRRLFSITQIGSRMMKNSPMMSWLLNLRHRKTLSIVPNSVFCRNLILTLWYQCSASFHPVQRTWFVSTLRCRIWRNMGFYRQQIQLMLTKPQPFKSLSTRMALLNCLASILSGVITRGTGSSTWRMTRCSLR